MTISAIKKGKNILMVMGADLPSMRPPSSTASDKDEPTSSDRESSWAYAIESSSPSSTLDNASFTVDNTSVSTSTPPSNATTSPTTSSNGTLTAAAFPPLPAVPLSGKNSDSRNASRFVRASSARSVRERSPPRHDNSRGLHTRAVEGPTNDEWKEFVDVRFVFLILLISAHQTNSSFPSLCCTLLATTFRPNRAIPSDNDRKRE